MDGTSPQLNRYFFQTSLSLHYIIIQVLRLSLLQGSQPSGIARHSYLILEETYTGESRLLGRIVDSVIEGIPNPSRTADNVLETSLAPIELLDVLGFSGHRVVGVSSKNNRMVRLSILKIHSLLFCSGVDS